MHGSVKEIVDSQVEAAENLVGRLGYIMSKRNEDCVVYAAKEDPERGFVCTPNEEGELRVIAFYKSLPELSDRNVMTIHRLKIVRMFEAARKGLRIVKDAE